ncbi:MAG: sodium/proline symporter [Pseudomonadales bacterium]|nr:sodium/proline symporter [Halioglobus sp.]MCP5121817.1 sodium/proline symporter [Pseudomonadales bacterium]MCP5192644.1 sodium/proline symporter [Pseudomonadales bacterium]
MLDKDVVLATLVIYQVLLILIGFWAQRRVSSEQDFFLASRQLGPWVAAVSYSASAASAWTLLGMSGLAFSIGVSSIWLALGAVLGCAFSWWVLAPRIMVASEQQQLLSATEFIALGTSGRQRQYIVSLVSAVILFSFVVYIASQFQGAGNTFASTFNMSSAGSIVLGGAIIVLYTLLGGFWAVSVTDTLQGLLMVMAAIALPVAALTQLGGPLAFWSALASQTSAPYMSLTGNSAGLAAIGMVAGCLAVGLSAIGQPHLVARFMALRDNNALRQGQIIATTWYAVVFFGMYLLGLTGRLLVADLTDAEQVFFAVNAALFPSALGAILLVAVLSAIMSTADSMLLVAGTTVAHDLGITRRFRLRALLVSRGVIAIISVAAIAVAIYIPATIFQRVLFAWVAIGSALGPVILCRALGVAIAPARILPAIGTGFIAAVICYLLPNTPGDIVERTLPFALGTAVLLLRRR